jgi:hypothetical protein
MGLNQTDGSRSDHLSFRTPFELEKKGMTNASKSPRGVRGFKLNNGTVTFGTWKVQGKIGGYTRWASLYLSLKVSAIVRRVVSPTPRAVC